MTHRFKKNSTVNSAMYRHFAVITLVCTAMLAMFADGEKAQALAQDAEARQKQKDVPHQEKVEPAAEVQQPSGSWGDDDGGFISSGLGSSQNFSNSDWGFSDGFMGTQTADSIARLSPSEREELKRAMAENGADGSSLAQARMSSIEAASRRRSGSLGIE